VTGRDRLIAALGVARDLTGGPGKVAELERLCDDADAIGDVRLAFETRLELVDAYDDIRERWRMLPAFTWCLAALDRDPDQFDDSDRELLRWYHRWAVGVFLGWSTVELALAGDLLDDLERRARQAGHRLRAVYRLRCAVADHVGDEATARKWLSRWRTAAEAIDDADGLPTARGAVDTDDCAGCDRARRAELLGGWGDWEAAVEEVEPVLRGRVACDRPERAYAAAMVPLLLLGRLTEASSAHLRSYPTHKLARDGFRHLADHLRFCALAGHPGRGIDLLGTHLGELDDPYDEASAMRFATAGALVCRLATEAGLGDRSVHRPAIGDRPARSMTVTSLGGALAAKAREIADRFDARNGTRHQSALVAGRLTEEPVAAVPAALGGVAPTGDENGVMPLTLESITAALDARGDRYGVDADGVVAGRWGAAYIQFERLGERREILHARIVATRRLESFRLAEAFEFCNAWNHDRLMPKAYVHDEGDGTLAVAGDVTTDLEHGVTVAQLAVLLHAAIATGATLADAVADLP
jgi:hypothetical protein